jgi:4-hydroxy-tetrahydrodipicolinate reductase
MSRVCRTVHRIRIVEIVNMRDYRSTMMDFMGFGFPPDVEPEICGIFKDAPNSPYAGPLTMIADAVGQELGAIRYEREVHVTPVRIEAPCGTFEPGTVVSTKARFVGEVDGRPFVDIELVWNVDDDVVPPDWPTGHCKWVLEIDGEPSIRTEMALETAVDAKRPTSITVAMSCLNAVPAVCAAPPGLANHLTLPVFGTRGGVKA